MSGRQPLHSECYVWPERNEAAGEGISLSSAPSRLGIAGSLTEMNQKAFFSPHFLYGRHKFERIHFSGAESNFLSCVFDLAQIKEGEGGVTINLGWTEKKPSFFSLWKIAHSSEKRCFQRRRRRRSQFGSQLRFIVEHPEKKKNLAGCDLLKLPVKHKQPQPIKTS